MDIVDKLLSNFRPSVKCAVTGHPFRPIKDNDTLTQERRDAACEITRLREENNLLREALEWYAWQAGLCPIIHSGGDAGRNALATDGGKIARTALATTGGE